MARHRRPLTPKKPRRRTTRDHRPADGIRHDRSDRGAGFVLPSEGVVTTFPPRGVGRAGREGLPSMEPRTAATRVPDPDAADFIRFCYRRRRVGWPELYDEMCAVAARGLFRGLGTDDLAAHGIGFSLFDMPTLAAMSSGIVAEEQALRRPMTVILAAVEAPADDVVPAPPTEEAEPAGERPVRFAAVPAGA